MIFSIHLFWVHGGMTSWLPEEFPSDVWRRFVAERPPKPHNRLIGRWSPPLAGGWKISAGRNGRTDTGRVIIIVALNVITECRSCRIARDEFAISWGNHDVVRGVNGFRPMLQAPHPCPAEKGPYVCLVVHSFTARQGQPDITFLRLTFSFSFAPIRF